MSEDELKAIEARADAATPGPWRWLNPRMIYSENTEVLCAWAIHADDSDIDCDGADRAFIVAARTDIPALVAEVRRLRRVIAAAEQNGDRPMAYPICPWCQSEHPTRHLTDCEAFLARWEVR